MRIFQVIEATANAAVPGSHTWLRNLYEPLLDLGHEVVLFPSTDGRVAMQRNSTARRAAFSGRLLDTFRHEHSRKPFDLFFAYLMDGMIEPSVIDDIRRAGVPTCNFSCNNVHQFHLVDHLSPHFDYNLHAEKLVRQKFLQIGATPLWWPMASNPKYSRPTDAARTIEASFVGANYALRAQYVSFLLTNGIDAHAYGPGWKSQTRRRLRARAKHYLLLLQTMTALEPLAQSAASIRLADHDYRESVGVRFPANTHGPVTDEGLVALYSRSTVSLGFLEVFDNHDPAKEIAKHVHLREFEAPMSGALYCTGFMDELAELFEPDKEVIMYRCREELLAKVRYYLGHPNEAESVRQAGRRRALADHTYHKRFCDLFRRLKLP